MKNMDCLGENAEKQPTVGYLREKMDNCLSTDTTALRVHSPEGPDKETLRQ